MAQLNLTEGAAPTTPAAGTVAIYVKTDGLLYTKDDAGVESTASFVAPIGVTIGGTGRATGTTAYALVATGTTATGAQQSLAAGATTEILVGGGAAALPVWTAASGSGAPCRVNTPTLITPNIGVASATSLATSAATPLLLTNGQLVNIALTSQTVGATTLTIPNFASVVDEFVFKTKSVTMSNKTFVAPVLGAATATSLNGMTITSSTGTFTLTNAKTLSVSNTLTFAGTDSTTMTFPEATASIGYRNVPQITKVADAAPSETIDLTSSGKHIYHTSTAGTITIPANGSIAYPIGTALTFVNGNGAGNLTIAITTDTMYLAGAGTTGSRTLAANGIATALKTSSTTWIISGTGLT